MAAALAGRLALVILGIGGEALVPAHDAEGAIAREASVDEGAPLLAESF